MTLPAYMAHWRELAIAAAHLQSSDLVRAEKALDSARQVQPDHAVVAYFTGLLRMEQATMAMRVPDGLNRVRNRLVSYTPTEDKESYERAAILELQFAIARAHEIRLDEPLIETDMQIEESVFVPRTGNLLAALGADNFIGQAHHTLFGVLMKRGELDAAEYHLGQVAHNGMEVLAQVSAPARDLTAQFSPCEAKVVLQVESTPMTIAIATQARSLS